MENNASIERLNSLCRKARAASLILFLICIVAAVGCVVSLIVSLTSGTGEITSADGSGTVVSASAAASRSVAALIICGLYGWALLICANIFAGIIENGTPFREGTVSALKKVALLTFLSGIVPSFVGFLLYLVTLPVPIGSVPFRVMVEQSGLTVAVVPLFLSMFLMVMTAVFKYGCLLQQESDETL